MLSNLRVGSLAVLAVAVLLIGAGEAGAEPGGGPGEGRGRFFGGGRMIAGSPIGLAMMRKVQDALKLSPEQRDQVFEINDRFRNDIRELLDDGADRKSMRALSQRVAKELSAVLDDEQEKRLRGITIQVAGANAIVADAELAKLLHVTDEQIKDLEKAQQENMRAVADALHELRHSDLPPKEHHALFGQLRDEAENRLLAVLTSDQQQHLKSLEGEQIEIDLSQLRPPHGHGHSERRWQREHDGRPDQGRKHLDRE